MSKDLIAGKLSEIMEAKAKIAMPEVVSVFISKYETQLYDRKAELADQITQYQQDLETLNETTLKQADFSKYVDIKVPKLEMISYLSEGPILNWDDEQFEATIAFRDHDKEKGCHRGAAKRFSQPIPVRYIKEHKTLNNNLSTTKTELQRVLALISDMSRKERQVKARISELRLQEQGLEEFLQDKEMQKLISF